VELLNVAADKVTRMLYGLPEREILYAWTYFRSDVSIPLPAIAVEKLPAQS
jgi:hypothetical protein